MIRHQQTIWFFLLLVAGIVLLRFPILVSDFQTFGGDTIRWAAPAINFAEQGFSQLNYLPTTSLGLYDVETRSLSRYITWPFPPSYLLSGFVLTFGESSWALRLLPLLLNFATAIYIYFLISKTFKNSWWGLVGASFFLLIPGGLYYSIQVCDTQFWLLGSVAGFYHLERWRINRQKVHSVATTFWFLFACASSWFGYMAGMIAALYILVFVVTDAPKNRLSALLHSPLPWLGIGVILILGIHIAQLVNGMGMEKFISIYHGKWLRYTGENIVDLHAAGGTLWDTIRETIQIRVENILYKSLQLHIPLYFSLPLAITSFLSLVIFTIRGLKGHEQELHKSCFSIILFFSSFYLAYALVFSSHMSRTTHNFTTQMLAPVFIVSLVYGVRWLSAILEAMQTRKILTYLPVISLTLLMLATTWSYRLDDPTQRNGGGRDRRIEAARLYGNTIADRTNKTDLILSNHQGWLYDNNIMKFTSRRTVKLQLFDYTEIEKYASDPRFEGVVYVYRERRDHEHNEPFEILKNKLELAAHSVTVIDDPKAYPGLTLYRLK